MSEPITSESILATLATCRSANQNLLNRADRFDCLVVTRPVADALAAQLPALPQKGPQGEPWSFFGVPVHIVESEGQAMILAAILTSEGKRPRVYVC